MYYAYQMLTQVLPQFRQNFVQYLSRDKLQLFEQRKEATTMVPLKKSICIVQFDFFLPFYNIVMGMLM